MWKKVISWLVIVLILGLIIGLLPLPSRINTVMTGVRWRKSDPNYSEPVRATIQGTYYRRLLRKDTFEGEMTIDGIDITEPILLQMSELRRNQLFTGFLLYNDPNQDHSGDVGMMSAKGVFKSAVIKMLVKDTEQWSDDYISLPAADRQSALAVLDGLYDPQYGMS